jgi:hypothetical protein
VIQEVDPLSGTELKEVWLSFTIQHAEDVSYIQATPQYC